MSHRYRFLGERQSDDLWLLTEQEAHHLGKVLRLETGDLVEIGDGQGTWALCSVLLITKSQVTLKVVTDSQGALAVYWEPEPSPRLEIAIGALRPGSLEEILPGLVEFGVDGIHLFRQPGAAKYRLDPKARERWLRQIDQSLKQCKRPHRPSLDLHDSLEACLGATGGVGTSLFYLAPAGPSTLLAELAALGQTQGRRLLMVVGGEMGLTRVEEESLHQNNAKPVRLGPHILRAMTAALGAVAVASCSLDRLRA